MVRFSSHCFKTTENSQKSKYQTTMFGFQTQWGSEIQTSLDSKWSKKVWVANGLDFKLDLNSGQVATILSKTI